MPNWNDILNEIQGEVQKGFSAVDIVRRKYLKQLFEYTNPRRNIIAYYSGFLSKPAVAGIEITDEDKDGLMLAVHKLDKHLGLDLILQTPGAASRRQKALLTT